VLGQHRSQSDDEHLALLEEPADMLRGPQLTALKQLDLATRDGEIVFAHVRLLLFESSRRPGLKHPVRPHLAPQRERPPELDSDHRPCLRAPARLQHHAQHTIDAEPGVARGGRRSIWLGR